MKKFLRIVAVIVALFVLFLGVKYFIPSKDITINNAAAVNNKVEFDFSSLEVDNKATILMNMDTNQIIYQSNIHNAVPVYSVSKVMFLATVSKELEVSKTSMDKKITVTELIDKVNKEADFSSADLKSGEVYTIRELYDAVMVPSGNDAAILLSYAIFGGHAQAVRQMNDNAKEWGMNDSSFVSTSGLDGKYLNKVGVKASSGKNLMSTYDSVILLKQVMKNYPEIIESGSNTVSTIGVFNNKVNKLETVNQVMEGMENGYDGVYGLKTGSNIEDYSNCIIALKKNEHNQVIAAISFDSKTRSTLYKDVSNLYDYLKTLELVNIKDELNLDARIGFVKKQPEIGLEKDYYLYKPKDTEFEYELKTNSKKFNNNLNEYYNVNKGSVLGNLIVSNKDLFFEGKATGISNVVVTSKVESKNIFSNIGEIIVDIIKK